MQGKTQRSQKHKNHLGPPNRVTLGFVWAGETSRGAVLCGNDTHNPLPLASSAESIPQGKSRQLSQDIQTQSCSVADLVRPAYPNHDSAKKHCCVDTVQWVSFSYEILVTLNMTLTVLLTDTPGLLYRCMCKTQLLY